MVRYTGRAKTQTGMNTNQVGLKMSGCPSRVGRKGTIIRKFNQRVNCMEGLCGGAKLNGKMWRTTYRNKEPFCKKRSTKCAQAAGGVGRINAPYFNRKVRAGESGCTPAAEEQNAPAAEEQNAPAGDVVIINGRNLLEGAFWRYFVTDPPETPPLPISSSGVEILKVELFNQAQNNLHITFHSPDYPLTTDLFALNAPVGVFPVNFPYQSVKVDFRGYTRQLSFATHLETVVVTSSHPLMGSQPQGSIWTMRTSGANFFPSVAGPFGTLPPPPFSPPTSTGLDTMTLTFT